MTRRRFHDFFAPIDGFAVRFSMRCDDGLPKQIHKAEPIEGRACDKVVAQLDLLNHLLKSVPWAMVAVQTAGNIGAVIEAAEARRCELYGPAVAA